MPKHPLFSNFLRFVDKTRGCWLWTGGLTGGYGHIKRSRYGQWKAHRYSWEQHIGPIPEGLFVLHKCDVRNCVNPDHLFIGTQKDNVHDCISKGKGNRGVRNVNAKLNDGLVLNILRERRPGKAIAKTLGVSAATISMIKNRKIWKHVSI